MVDNIFQGLGDVGGRIANDLRQEDEQLRRQKESLLATKLLNDLETESSQRLLDQQENFDGSYNFEQSNNEWIAQRRDQILSKVDNKNVRNMFSQGASNYESKYKIQAKSLAISFEREQQAQLAKEDLSFKIAKIRSNPTEETYAEEMEKLDQASAGWSAKFKRDAIPTFKNAMATNLVKGYQGKSEMAFEDGKLTEEDLLNEYNNIRAFVNNQDTPLDANTRSALNDSLDSDLKQVLHRGKIVRQAKQKEKNQSFIALAADGDYTLTEEDIQQGLAAYDNEFDRDQYLTAVKVAQMAGPVNQLMKTADFDAASDNLSSLQQEYLEAVESKSEQADDLRAAYVKLKSDYAGNLKKFKENPADYLSTRDPNINQLYQQGLQRGDLTDYVDYIQKKSTGLISPAEIKFLPESVAKAYAAQLADFNGDFGGYREFVTSLRESTNVPIRGMPSHTMFDSVVRQLQTMENSGIPKPILGALEYIGKSGDSTLFNILRVKGKSALYETGQLDLKKVKERLGDKLQRFNDAWQNSGTDIDARYNPAAIQTDFLMYMAERAPDAGVGSNETEIADYLFDTTIGRNFKVFRTYGGRSMAIKTENWNEQTQKFLQSRKSVQKAAQTFLEKNNPIPDKAKMQAFSRFGDVVPSFTLDQKGQIRVTYPEAIERVPGAKEILLMNTIKQSGHFKPVGDGQTYRMYVNSRSYGEFPLIMGQNEDGSIKYMDINSSHMTTLQEDFDEEERIMQWKVPNLFFNPALYLPTEQ